MGFVIVVAMLFGLMALTGTWTPRLGLDLRGGTTITLTARTEDGSTVPRENLETARGIIQNRVDSLGVGESSVTIQGNDKIEVAVPNMGSDELVELVGATAKLAFRPVIAVQEVQPAATETTEPSAEATPSDQATSEATETGSPSAAASTAQRRPVPQLPTEPPASSTPRPTAPGDEELSLDDELNYSPTDQDVDDYLAYQCGDDFPDVVDQPLIACDETGTAKYFLGPVILSGEHVTDASAGIPQGEVSWIVSLSFDDQGSATFADATEALSANQQPQNQFAIVLDSEVISAPSVSERISGGQASISGTGITEDTAKALASTLRYGSLPVDLETSSVDTVSPALGGNQMTAGLIAGLIGLALVLVYSLVYYRGLTLVVAGSLVAAATVTYAVMVLLGSAVGFALNLPGIAGAIVAIGVTADSFVVYFERIRDEIRDGHSLRHSIQSGWHKARGTILMADGVQLLAAVVLYFLAIGSVKGFAFTLGVTTAIDLLLVIFFTHPLMTVLGRTKFFGQGHKNSGLDPAHLGVSRASLLGRRGTTRKRTKTRSAGKSGKLQAEEASNE
ncbi:protein translocase subunit SecD [Propionimicrobium sp. PCR01-08-3]|uniref:protein translocase subunit SecD n=1 Tax=Propionimicrobium sp. PCR01-08-3 TaxID=3052086 RepID=UPI00255CFBDD|nr:protein translocase subunit SecD [Propionimicrobium sp. PCR01-08-3]WIY84194.1 protein translocase subunit SecD [Propionimicrobium sp. PCR01-08-3]